MIFSQSKSKGFSLLSNGQLSGKLTKSSLILSLVLAISTITYGQTSKIRVTFSSISNNDVIFFENVVGSAGYKGKTFFSVGVNYIRPWKDWLEIETALEYSKFTMEINPPFFPGIDNESYNTEVTLVNIPVTLRANFLDYFYANSGVLLDFDVSNSNAMDNQSGIGSMVGVGATYDFDFGASIFINPYFKIHSMMPFAKEGSAHQRLTESAIRFGITYQL